MAVSLSKGQSVSLVKQGGGTLTRVAHGPGLGRGEEEGHVRQAKAQSIDLDASALLFDAQRQLVDQVWFQQLRSKDGSVQHTGDNLTGAGDGDDESIIVDLARLPAAVTEHRVRGQLLHRPELQPDRERLLPAGRRDQPTSELARYELTGSGQPQQPGHGQGEPRRGRLVDDGDRRDRRPAARSRDLLPAVTPHL